MSCLKFDYPAIDWGAADLFREFTRFRDHVHFMFTGPFCELQPKQKAEWLRTWIGENGREVFTTFPLEESQKDDPDKVLGHLEMYFRPKKNKRIARHRLRQRKQRRKESFAKFVRDLSIILMDCDYADSEDMLIDAIINGIYEPEAQQRLLDQGDGLTLGKVLEIGQQFNTSPKEDYRIEWDEDDYQPGVSAMTTQTISHPEPGASSSHPEPGSSSSHPEPGSSSSHPEPGSSSSHPEPGSSSSQPEPGVSPLYPWPVSSSSQPEPGSSSSHPEPGSSSSHPEPGVSPLYPWPVSSPWYAWPGASSSHPEPGASSSQPEPSSSSSHPEPGVSSSHPEPGSSSSHPEPGSSSSHPEPGSSSSHPEPGVSPSYPWPVASPWYAWPGASPSYPRPQVSSSYPRPRHHIPGLVPRHGNDMD